MARVPSLQWEKPESVQCQGPELYVGGLGEEIRRVDRMNQQGDSEGMQWP
jgi:hypothetical protein